MRRNAGPVQQWVDSIPSPTKAPSDVRVELEDIPTPPLTPVSSKESAVVKPSMTVSTAMPVPVSPAITMTGVPPSPIAHNRLVRDPSFQSDSSHCSSVESLLELRRADPEAILLGLGFGGCSNVSQENGPLSRIPKRFLQPSKLQGIAINDFVKHQQETNESLDSASLGYRGLTGSPYVAPSEIVQKIMERLRDHECHEQDAYVLHNNNTEPYSPIFQDTSRLSVLSPDNRQFLERPRSKSPDMRNKRMIIGQKSFAFGCNGDLIEINPLSQQTDHSSTNGNVDNHELELENSLVASGVIPGVDGDTPTHPDCRKETKSTMSNVRKERILAKQLSIDNSAQDLNSSESNYIPDSLYSRSCEDSQGFFTNIETSRRFDDEDTLNQWKLEQDQKEEDRPKRENSPRRASDGSYDMKKMPWARLSRDEKRRFSDGFIRTTSLSSRRKSLRRQLRISDAEASEYCDVVSPPDLVLSEDNKCFEFGKPAESMEVTENTKVEDNETDRGNHKSDRLSTSEKLEDSSMEINGNASGGDNVPEIKAASSKESKKKRKGLSAILGMYTSVMSMRMEPGF